MLFRLDFQSAVPIYRQIRLLKADGYLVTDRRAGAVVRAPRGKAAGLSADQTARLNLLAGEARLAGLTLDDFVAACKAAFGETED